MPAKKKGATKKPSSADSKVLKELKAMNKLLKEIKEILDNTWRERLPVD